MRDAWVMGTFACARRAKYIGMKSENGGNLRTAKCLCRVLNYSPLFLPNQLWFLFLKALGFLPLGFFLALGRGERAGVVGLGHRLLGEGKWSIGRSFAVFFGVGA